MTRGLDERAAKVAAELFGSRWDDLESQDDIAERLQIAKTVCEMIDREVANALARKRMTRRRKQLVAEMQRERERLHAIIEKRAQGNG